ncbi:MAG: hypothetical protein ACR2PB_04515 [Desulfocapsaceae bacterium]
MDANLSLITAHPLTRGCWLAAAAVLLLLCGCSDPLTEENEALRKEIIEVHDQAMEKIGYMFVLEGRLKKIQPSPDLPRESIDSAREALQQANREMFRWMNQYQTLFVDDDLGRDNSYRRQQLDMIRTVGRMTRQAIDDAEHILAAD